MVSDELKIKSLFELSKITKELGSNNITTGLICGCFDILHIGHIRLIKFAKSKVDILIVGLDTDISIRKTKGSNRPINPLLTRMEMMTALSFVDFVFPLDAVFEFGTDDSTNYWTSMLTTLHPGALFTTPKSDPFYNKKQSLAKLLDIEFISYSGLHKQSTTDIEKILLAEKE
jgi:cytidyltransferase-like protein